MENNTQQALSLIGQKTPVCVQDTLGNTPLHYAVINNNAWLAACLAKAGKNTLINMQNEAGDTALHVAAANGNSAIISMLIGNGASIYATNKQGETALHLANAHTLASILTNQKCDLEMLSTTPELYTTLLQSAVTKGTFIIVYSLLL